MNLTAEEIQVLTAICNADPAAGEYVPLKRLSREVPGDVDFDEDFEQIVRELSEKQLVAIDKRGRATATEAGIAALKSI
jgi:hypothetical protein